MRDASFCRITSCRAEIEERHDLHRSEGSPEIGFMIPDTLITPLFPIKGQDGPVNGQYHALKVQVLDGDTAVGFATSNDADVCMKIIAATQEALAKDAALDVPSKIFEEYHAQAEGKEPHPDCEFLVLKLSTEGKKLAHVTWNEVRSCERAHIGDPAAHKRASELQVKYEPPKTESVQQSNGSFKEVPVVASDAEIDYIETRNTVDAVVNEWRTAGIGAIGGHTVVVVDARLSKKLEYMQSVYRGRTAEEGVVGYSLLADNQGQRGIALYFDGGCFGYILPVGDPNYCYKHDAATLADFIALAKGRYNLALTGGTW
jgi:hypothetical protein